MNLKDKIAEAKEAYEKLSQDLQQKEKELNLIKSEMIRLEGRYQLLLEMQDEENGSEE